MSIANNATGEMLCESRPIYGGQGGVQRHSPHTGAGFSEDGFIAVPPCLWGSAEHGLDPPPALDGLTIRIVKVSNATWGHHGVREAQPQDAPAPPLSPRPAAWCHPSRVQSILSLPPRSRARAHERHAVHGGVCVCVCVCVCVAHRARPHPAAACPHPVLLACLAGDGARPVLLCLRSPGLSMG